MDGRHSAACILEGIAVLELPLANKIPYWMLCLRAELYEEGEFILRGHRNVRMLVLDAEGVVR